MRPLLILFISLTVSPASALSIFFVPGPDKAATEHRIYWESGSNNGYASLQMPKTIMDFGHLAAGKYFFWVTALDKYGNESDKSEVLEVRVIDGKTENDLFPIHIIIKSPSEIIIHSLGVDSETKVSNGDGGIYIVGNQYTTLTDIANFLGSDIGLGNIELWVEVPIETLAQSVPDTFPNSTSPGGQMVWENYNPPIIKTQTHAIMKVAERLGKNYKPMSFDIYTRYRTEFGIEAILTQHELLTKLQTTEIRE